ncbi:unnamed protein product [Alopecurus aequalis]
MRVVKAARLPSMEREPKTLSLDELNNARVRTHATPSLDFCQIFVHAYILSLVVNFLQKAALYVMSTHSSQDAARIFTEGLKPVLLAGRNSTDSDSDDDGDVFDPEDAFFDDHDARRRQLRVSIPKKRDFATAPF